MPLAPPRNHAPAIATIANLLAAACFFTIASRVTHGSAGYAVAGGLFALGGAVNILRWRRTNVDRNNS